MSESDPDLFDICANRHRGNEESVQANQDTSRIKSRQRERVLDEIRLAGSRGCSVDELAARFDTNPNNLSGRFSELKKLGLIFKIGTRPTRTGSSAGVYASS